MVTALPSSDVLAMVNTPPVRIPFGAIPTHSWLSMVALIVGIIGVPSSFLSQEVAKTPVQATAMAKIAFS